MDFDKPPPEPLASATGFLLSWNGRRSAEGFAKVMAEAGMRPPDFGVMRLIDAKPGLTQAELVAGAMIDPSSMVAVLDHLEGEGLVERRPHPSDRRKHAVHLTAKGEKLLARAMEVANEYADELLAPLSAGERDALHVLLRKLAGLEG